MGACVRRAPVALLATFLVAALAQGSFTDRQANAYIAAHNWNEAVRYASAWAKAEPANSHPWGALGIAYGIGLHQPDKAIEAFQKALKIRPDWAECWNAIGIEYTNLKNFSDAAAAFKRAAEHTQVKPNYWNNLAAAYSETNQRDLALQALDNDERLAAPHGSWADWYNLGNGYNRLLEYAKAVNAYQRAVKLSPQQGKAWNNLGSSEQSMGQFDQALQHFKKAKDLGDSLGKQNYDALQNAMAEAERQAQSPGMTLEQRIRMQGNMRWGRMKSWDQQHPSAKWYENPYRS